MSLIDCWGQECETVCGRSSQHCGLDRLAWGRDKWGAAVRREKRRRGPRCCRRKRRERGMGGLMGGRWRKSPAVPLCCDNSVVSVPQDGWEWNHYLVLSAGGHGRVFLTLFFFFFHISLPSTPTSCTHGLQRPEANGTGPLRLVK